MCYNLIKLELLDKNIIFAVRILILEVRRRKNCGEYDVYVENLWSHVVIISSPITC